MIIFTAIYSHRVHARANSSASSDPRVVIETSLNVTSGSMGNKDGTIPVRAMTTGAAGLNLGMRIGFFVPLLMAEYRYSAQSLDPSEVRNQNLSGSGYMAGAGLRFEIGSFMATFGYEFLGEYKLEKATTGGLDSNYSEGTGMLAWLSYRIDHKRNLYVCFHQSEFAKSKVGPTTTDITNNKLSETSYGLGLSYSFF